MTLKNEIEGPPEKKKERERERDGGGVKTEKTDTEKTKKIFRRRGAAGVSRRSSLIFTSPHQ
jgi:hypothetical protein